MHFSTPFLGLDRVRHPSHCPSHPFPLAAAAPRQEATSTTKASRAAARATGLERAMGLVRPAACPAARPAPPPRGCGATSPSPPTTAPAEPAPAPNPRPRSPAPLRPILRTLSGRICGPSCADGAPRRGGVVFQKTQRSVTGGGAGEGLDNDARGERNLPKIFRGGGAHGSFLSRRPRRPDQEHCARRGIAA